jgi:hypothetical protein
MPGLMRAVEKVTGAGITTPRVGTATTKDVIEAVVEAVTGPTRHDAPPDILD